MKTTGEIGFWIIFSTRGMSSCFLYLWIPLFVSLFLVISLYGTGYLFIILALEISHDLEKFTVNNSWHISAD